MMPSLLDSTDSSTEPSKTEIRKSLATRGLDRLEAGGSLVQHVLNAAADEIHLLRRERARYDQRLAFLRDEVERHETNCRALEQEAAVLNAAGFELYDDTAEDSTTRDAPLVAVFADSMRRLAVGDRDLELVVDVTVCAGVAGARGQRLPPAC